MIARVLILLWVLILPFLFFACNCGDDDDDADPGTSVDDDDHEATDDDDDNDDASDDDDDNDDDNDDDSGLPVFSAIAEPPSESVLPLSIESCSVYREETCIENTLHECELYDGGSKGWVTDPDPMLEQMYRYDRYYDLYHEMEGQHSDLEFTVPMPPGTPESTWGDPQFFREYDGFGDGAGWTGTALQSAAARYAETGTEADYERMLKKFQTMMFLYEANEIPGLLMRSFFAMLEDGAPKPIGHPGKAIANYIAPGAWHFRYPLSDEMLARLPSYFTEGVNILGTDYSVTPVWMGDASRDMYVRSLPGVLLAYDLLGDGEREDALRRVVEQEIPCTLKRMKKLRISNLQSNPFILEALQAYLGANRLILEEDDLDLTSIDTIYGYVMEQPNPEYLNAFDPACPDSLPMEVDPDLDLDAGNLFEFFFKFANLAARMQNLGAVPIAWPQFPSMIGSDALFLTQWALAGHYLTGDERFLEFLEQMMEENHYWEVIDQMGSFYSPKWCKPHYGPSLLYPTLWNMQNRVDPETFPEYWNRLGGYIAEETRHKDLVDANDVYFGILYDTMATEAIDPQVHAYAGEMADMLRETGQMQVADKMEPRRNYNVDLISDPPEGLVLEELTEQEYDMCMQPIELFGIPIDIGDIEDERPRAVEGMPIPWRVPGSFQWQMDPYMLYRDYGGGEAMTQWPMQGFSVAFWIGRMQGTITEGEGMALGWRDTGKACP